MTEPELWSFLGSTGNLDYGWWYSAAALPALLVAMAAYALTWFTRRNEPTIPRLFAWLVAASVPLLMVAPSLYVAVALEPSLEHAGLARTMAGQRLSPQTARQVTQQLSALAALGIGGVALSIALIGTSAARGGFAPPAIAWLSRRLTRTMTRSLGPRASRSPVLRSGLGTVRVERGQQRGACFGVKAGAVIGKDQATITLTDAIVSRRHARLVARATTVMMFDEDSTNGTFVTRSNRLLAVHGDGIALEHGDRIFLGHPDEPAAVELIFERPT